MAMPLASDTYSSGEPLRAASVSSYSSAWSAHVLPLFVLLVEMRVTNRGGCVSSRSSGSPLVLGNQKLREEALLVGRKNRYLCTVEIKSIPPIPAFGRSLFVYSYLRFQRLTSLTSGCDDRALQASTPALALFTLTPALFTVCDGFGGKGVRGDCLHLFTNVPISYFLYRALISSR